MMENHKDILIVLDSYEYQIREKEFASLLEDMVQPHFFYSKYENSLTEKFAKTKYTLIPQHYNLTLFISS